MTSSIKTARTRIVCLCEDPEAKGVLTRTLTAAGYQLVLPQETKNFDIALIDLRRQSLSAKKARSISILLRRGSPDCRLFFLTSEDMRPTSREALRRHGEVISSGDDIAHVVERFRQVIRLRNIAEETGERLKSLTSLNRLASFPIISAPTSPPKILIAGAPGPSALAAVNALQGDAAFTVSVFSGGQIMRALDHDEFDGLVIIPSDEHDSLLTVARTLRRHTKHFALPMIAVANNGTEAGLYGCKGATDTILAAHLASDLQSRILLSTRRARLVKSMKIFLNACEGEGVRDPASSAFSGTFALEHGARLCARADQTGRPLSAVILRLKSAHKQTGEPGRNALQRAAKLINRLTRAEDMVARIAPSTFLTLMPATSRGGAEKASLRMEGVLENTVFRGEHDIDLYSLRVSTGSYLRAEGACIEEVVARALANLREDEEVTTTALQQQSQR